VCELGLTKCVGFNSISVEFTQNIAQKDLKLDILSFLMQIVMQEIIFKINFYVKLQIKCTKVIGVDFQNCFFSINLKKIKFYRINDTSEFYFSVHSLTNELIV